MPAASQILKNFQLFLDGRGYAGNVDELQLPGLKVKNEEYRAGGMDAPVALDMGMEKMECTFKLSKFDQSALALWGAGPGNTTQMTIRGALESLDGSVIPLVVNIEGTVDDMTPESITAGGKSGLSVMVSVRHYKLTINNVVIHDIDVINMTRIINGVDRMASIRTAIGL
jgi:uncharacterized protein